MSEQDKYAHDLFISYADADRAWVEGYLLDALTQAGVRCHSEAAFVGRAAPVRIRARGAGQPAHAARPLPRLPGRGSWPSYRNLTQAEWNHFAGPNIRVFLPL